MSRVYLGLVERGEELGLGQARLPEQSPLPCLMLLASNEAKTDAPEDHPELAVGGRRHLRLEKAARSCGGGIDAESPDVPGVGCAIGAPAEPIEPLEWRSDVWSIPISFKKVK